MEITLTLVTNLIAQQFPQWAQLPIKPVEFDGWDNRTFRLGSQMTVRMPSAQCYAAKVAIEQKWLPFLAPHLSIAIPMPLAMGQPTQQYSWQWSIYRWIEGTSANCLHKDALNLPLIAQQLSQFLNELHSISSSGAPLSGTHNFFRGDHPRVYDTETKNAIAQLKNFIDVNACETVWKRALSSEWTKNPFWIHGDMSAGNILIQNKQLVGVIDFGGMAVGDPACDLVIAWTFFSGESRTIFKELINLDAQTWDRARGWALWKALITLARLKDKSCPEAVKQQNIIETILYEQQKTQV